MVQKHYMILGVPTLNYVIQISGIKLCFNQIKQYFAIYFSVKDYGSWIDVVDGLVEDLSKVHHFTGLL